MRHLAFFLLVAALGVALAAPAVLPGTGSAEGQQNSPDCKEPPNADPDGDGQPNGSDADDDNDGMSDEDEKPDDPETAGPSYYGGSNPCKADTDDDGFRDPQDTCPRVKGSESEANGCPAIVVVGGVKTANVDGPFRLLVDFSCDHGVAADCTVKGTASVDSRTRKALRLSKARIATGTERYKRCGPERACGAPNTPDLSMPVSKALLAKLKRARRREVKVTLELEFSRPSGEKIPDLKHTFVLRPPGPNYTGTVVGNVYFCYPRSTSSLILHRGTRESCAKTKYVGGRP